MKILPVNNYQTQSQNVNSYSDQRANFSNYSNSKAELNDNITFTSKYDMNKGDKVLRRVNFILRGIEANHWKQDPTPNDLKNLPSSIDGIVKGFKATINGTDIEGLESKNLGQDRCLIILHANKDRIVGRPETKHAAELLKKNGYVQGSTTAEMIKLGNEQGFYVIAPEYTGFAGRPFKKPNGEIDPKGVITTAGLINDGKAVVNYATKTLGFPAKKVYVIGHSVGGGVSLNLDEELGGIIVNSAFPDSNRLGQFILSNMTKDMKPINDLVNMAHLQSFEVNPIRKWNNLEALNGLKDKDIEVKVIQALDDEEQPEYLARLLKEAADNMGYDKFSYITVPDGRHFGLTKSKLDAISEALASFAR